MNALPRRCWAALTRRALIQFALVALAVCGVSLESASAQTGEADPPGRVARLADVVGNVWLYHPDSGDWIQASRNLPLTSGDTLSTDPGARAELQVGSATLRLDSGSELQVIALDDSRMSWRLQAGAMSARVRNPAETGAFDVTTEEGRFSVLAAGRYRFDRGTGSSFVGVDSGQVRYEYGASALTVAAGQRAEFWIDANGAAQYGLGAAVYDAFTAWNNERDRGAERSVAATRYLSPEMTGVEDLDRYGNWEQTPDYGAVWIPAAVASDWAPYSAGRWAWVRPWGWTWVDDAPWGFAPFHYGRWVNVRDRWCWAPGERQRRPVYAPALVGWVGGAPRGGGVSIAAGVGPAVGWFPLAPREVYVPSYRSSPRYARDINVSNVRNVENINIVINNPSAPRDFENRRFPRAVTVAPTTVFTERRPVASAQYRDAPWARDFARQGGSAPVLTAPPVAAPVAPIRQADNRPVRPPPPAFGEQRAGFPGRPQQQRDRDGPRPDSPSAQPPGVAAVPSFGATGAQPLPSQVAPPPSRVRPLPVRPSFGEPGDRDGRQPGAQELRPPPATSSTPAQRPQTPPTAAPELPADAGRVRPLPRNEAPDQRRSDDPGRADQRRGADDRRSPAMRREPGPEVVRSLPSSPAPTALPAAPAVPAPAPISPARPADPRPADPRPAEARPFEGRPAESRPGEGRPGEARPGEARPGEARPFEGRPAEARPAEAPRMPERAAPGRLAEQRQPPATRPDAGPVRPEVAAPRAPEVQAPRVAPMPVARPAEPASPRPVEPARPAPPPPGVPARTVQ